MEAPPRPSSSRPPGAPWEQLTCLRQVKAGMNMGKRCLRSRPRGPAPKISPARKGWVHRQAVERRRCGTTLCVCSLGAKNSVGESGEQLLRSLGRQQSKGAPGLAFETWAPCNRSPMETHPPLCVIPSEVDLSRPAVEGSAVLLHHHPTFSFTFRRHPSRCHPCD
jgi:hypothetical protein